MLLMSDSSWDLSVSIAVVAGRNVKFVSELDPFKVTRLCQWLFN